MCGMIVKIEILHINVFSTSWTGSVDNPLSEISSQEPVFQIDTNFVVAKLSWNPLKN